MKIKNLKVYLLGTIILANSTFCMSCSIVKDKYEKTQNKEFYDFLEDNGIVSINDLHDIIRNYYEAEVSEQIFVADGVIESTHYEVIDDIDYVVCQGREHDYDYKVLKIEKKGSGFEVVSKVIEDIDVPESGYDYVYQDDYVIEDGCRDVLITYGKVIKR